MTAPLYTSHNLAISHRLYFTWIGWPIEGLSFSPTLPASLFTSLANMWDTDGMSLLQHHTTPVEILLTFKTTPGVTPVFIAQRAKGRLQHALRQSGCPASFSRKTSIRSLGFNNRETVARYLDSQVSHSYLADPKFKITLAERGTYEGTADIKIPAETNSGRYWYDLHLVMTTADCYRMGSADTFDTLRDSFIAAAQSQGCAIAKLSLMPDHAHIALRGAVEKSPIDIGVALQNQTAHAMKCQFWKPAFYAGTFGEYRLDAILDK